MMEDGEEERGDGLLEGRYANQFKVGYNAFEFLFEFGQFFPQGKALFFSRIITSPAYAAAFLEILQESVERYQETFGKIDRER